MRLALLACLVLAGCSNEGDRCFAMARQGVKDPEGAQLVSWVKEPQANNVSVEITKVTMRATNSYGAYGQVFGVCRGAGYKLTKDAADTSMDGAWVFPK